MGYENFKTGFNKPTIITAQQYGTKVSVELDHSDTDLDELMDAFRTIIIGLGYFESSWKQYIIDKADEYKEEEIENDVDMDMYEPSFELRKATEEYVKQLSTKDIDEALAEHNTDEEDDEWPEPNEALKKAAKKYKANLDFKGYEGDNFEDYQNKND
jgi:hypothetical protein